MSKKVNRGIYVGKRIVKSALGEFMDSLSFLLYFSSAPISVKALQEYFIEEDRFPALQMSISRLYRKGFISKIKRGDNIFISFKDKFLKKEEDYEKAKRKKHQQGWDKKWRILIYDIPEREKGKREVFRSFIRKLGFGMVQYSCWTSAYDYSKEIYEFSTRHEVLDYICMHEGKFSAGKSIDLLVNEVWHLKDLLCSYKAFIDECKEGIEFIKTKEVKLKEYYGIYHRLYRQYKSLLLNDPFLPEMFFKANPRPKAEILFKKLASETFKELKLKM